MLPREMLSKLVMIDSVVALGSVPLVRRNLFATADGSVAPSPASPLPCC